MLAKVSTLLNHLECAQWWPEDIMRDHQSAHLQLLLSHAYRTVPFYRRRFDEAGIAPDRACDPELWHSLPILTREDVQDAGDQLHSSHLPEEHGQSWLKWTSGSTAKPLSVLRTSVTARFWIANTVRAYLWRGCDFGQKIAFIRPMKDGEADPPHGQRLQDWGFSALFESGPRVVLCLKSSTTQQLEWLERERPAYLHAYPSVLTELARYSIELGCRLEGLRQVHSFGESVDAKCRNLCQHAWGTEILDSYTANETGHIAVECASHRYHVQSEHLLVEVLDEHGHACAPGDVGRVVITDLFNYAMPLVRYEIGDLAQVGIDCECGRKLPVLSHIVGRQRSMFLLPNNERRLPLLDIDPTQAFAGKLPIRQFQIAQVSRTMVEVRIVSARPLVSVEEAAIHALLANSFGDCFELRFKYVDRIERGPAGKFEDFLCELAHGD